MPKCFTAPVIGPLVASPDEFVAFRAWFVERFCRYPEAAWLVGSDQWSCSGTTRAELLQPLATELGEIVRSAKDDVPGVARVATALARALRERPTGPTGFTISGGGQGS